MNQMKLFALHDRVIVSSGGGWKRASSATVVSEPEPVQTLQGPEFYYWVRFDEPQETIDGDDAYYKAQVLSRYLDRG
jgi:hypothetical protein